MKEEEEQLTPEEIRGKRRKRLTMNIVDSPLIKKKSKRKSGGYDVEEKGRMNDGLDISLVEPVLEPGKEKAIKMRQSAAKESFGKKGKTSKASEKRRKRKGDSEPVVEAVVEALNKGRSRAEVEPVLEPEKGKANERRRSAAKESFSKKGKTSKASGKKEPAAVSSDLLNKAK